MRIATLLLAVSVLAAACGKKKEEKAPEPDKTGPDKIVAPAKKSTAFDCPSLLPQDVRDKYFAGWTLAPGAPTKTSAGKTLDCVFQKGGETQMVQVICNALADDIVTELLGNLRKSMNDVTDVPGVGKLAFEGMQSGRRILRFQDDDTPCYGSLLSVPSSADVAKVLVGNLTPATMKN